LEKGNARRGVKGKKFNQENGGRGLEILSLKFVLQCHAAPNLTLKYTLKCNKNIPFL
jgi:hypothetical protein